MKILNYLKSFLKKDNSKDIEIISEAELIINGYFCSYNYSTLKVKYKDKILDYEDFKKAFFVIYPSFIERSIKNDNFFIHSPRYYHKNYV